MMDDDDDDGGDMYAYKCIELHNSATYAYYLFTRDVPLNADCWWKNSFCNLDALPVTGSTASKN